VGRRRITSCVRALPQIPNLEDTEAIAVPSHAPNDVKKAYMRAARAIHPDKLTGATIEKSTTAQHVFAILTAAYDAVKQAAAEQG
jgi:DnaJ-class molecular chaperone